MPWLILSVLPALMAFVLLPGPGACDLGDPRFLYPPLKGAIVVSGQVLEVKAVPDPRHPDDGMMMAVVSLKIEKTYRGDVPDTITVHTLNLFYSRPGSKEIRFREIVGAPIFQKYDNVLMILTRFSLFNAPLAHGYTVAEYVPSWVRFLHRGATFAGSDELCEKEASDPERFPDSATRSDGVAIYNDRVEIKLVETNSTLGETVQSIITFYSNLKAEDQE